MIISPNANFERSSMRITGEYETLGTVSFFIPDALPPQNPPLVLSNEIIILYGEAMLELGKLTEMANRLPNIERFIKAYVIKEALLSSAIEGIHTSILEVFTQPLSESKASKNTQLVMNYTKALGVALTLIRKNGLPITARVLLQAHEALMQMGDGDKSDPGKYRKQPVRVGNLIPPPPQKVPSLMSQLEHYMNLPDHLPPLIKAGLAHVQFETIHPFLYGNGRIGPLFIILMLVEHKILSQPILYLSYYFKKHHMEYYQRLDAVRTHGDFERWITFYLKAMKGSASSADARAKDREVRGQDLTNQMIHDKKLSMSMRDMRLHAISMLSFYRIIIMGQRSR